MATGLCTTLATATTIVTQNDNVTVDFNAPIQIALNATGAVADGDVTSRLLKYEYYPVKANFGIL